MTQSEHPIHISSIAVALLSLSTPCVVFTLGVTVCVRELRWTIRPPARSPSRFVTRINKLLQGPDSRAQGMASPERFNTDKYHRGESGRLIRNGYTSSEDPYSSSPLSWGSPSDSPEEFSGRRHFHALGGLVVVSEEWMEELGLKSSEHRVMHDSMNE